MDQDVTLHFDNAMATVQNLFTKVITRIAAIKPGETLPATKMSAELAAEIGTTGPALYPTLKILIDKFPGVEIRKGAHGGIYRPLPNEKKVNAETKIEASEPEAV